MPIQKSKQFVDTPLDSTFKYFIGNLATPILIPLAFQTQGRKPQIQKTNHKSTRQEKKSKNKKKVLE